MKKRIKGHRLKVRIRTTQRKIAINKKRLIHLAKKILEIKGLNNAELSILFVGKQRIRTLNKRFRKKDRPTDVLAFSMRQGRGAFLHPQILGDVVICPQIAQAAAKIYQTYTEKEILLYLIHGILHLLGYCDKSQAARLRMEKEQLRILKKLAKDGKTRHYSKF